MKLPAMILLMLGFVSLVFGVRSISQQMAFVHQGEITYGTVLTVSSGGRHGNGSPMVVVSYQNNGTAYTDRLHLPLFSNALEFTEGDTFMLLVDKKQKQDPEVARTPTDGAMYYVSGVFFILLGLVFALMGLLIQKFGKD